MYPKLLFLGHKNDFFSEKGVQPHPRPLPVPHYLGAYGASPPLLKSYIRHCE